MHFSRNTVILDNKKTSMSLKIIKKMKRNVVNPAMTG